MFKLEIDCSNAAFADSMHHEVARILREIAAKVEGGPPSGKCRDVNGNTVGEYGFHNPYNDDGKDDA
jgi:hypothetical protein